MYTYKAKLINVIDGGNYNMHLNGDQNETSILMMEGSK